MSDQKILTIKPSTRLRKLHRDAKGHAHLGGRWNLRQVADHIIERQIWLTLDELAKFVYGTTSQRLRENVRKRIPRQRQFMLLQLEYPIVTQFGERGRIERIKIYNSTDGHEQMLMTTELDRALERKEFSEQKYEYLKRLLLPTP